MGAQPDHFALVRIGYRAGFKFIITLDAAIGCDGATPILEQDIVARLHLLAEIYASPSVVTLGLVAMSLESVVDLRFGGGG